MTTSPAGDLDSSPTASLPMLRLRAEMLNWLRAFFRDYGYWEVETPLLSHDVCVDAWLEPFHVPGDSITGTPALFLQTSPEFGMKRLLAAGAEAIFQITRAFRREETGRLHNPEFTIIEWYRVGDSYLNQTAFVEELVVGFGAALTAGRAEVTTELRRTASGPAVVRPSPARPFVRMTYGEAFARALGQDVLLSTARELAQLADARHIVTPASLGDGDRDGWRNLLFVESVEPILAREAAVFVTDYPATQAALARIRAGDPPVAERFELFLSGVEICNGYQELTDPDELRRRVTEQSDKRRRAGRPPLPADSRLLQAMDAGLPECAGVALGFDRLLMTLCGASSLDEVLAFPFSRA